jgi:hypothetical protein
VYVYIGIAIMCLLLFLRFALELELKMTNKFSPNCAYEYRAENFPASLFQHWKVFLRFSVLKKRKVTREKFLPSSRYKIWKKFVLIEKVVEREKKENCFLFHEKQISRNYKMGENSSNAFLMLLNAECLPRLLWEQTTIFLKYIW